MTSITGLGKTSPVQYTQSSTKKPQDENKETGNRPATKNFDNYDMSQEAQSTLAMIEEELAEEETLFDYMEDVPEAIDYEDLGISEEDMDFSEFEAFSAIGEEVVEETAEETVEETGNGLDITVEGADVGVEEDTEADVEEDTQAETVVNPNKVHGYLSSLTEEDRAMLAIAYQANEMLTMQGATLFDYLGDTSSWFDQESGSTGSTGSTSSTSTDWEKYLEEFNALAESLGSTEGTEEDKVVEEDSDVLEEIEDESILNEDPETSTASEEEVAS